MYLPRQYPSFISRNLLIGLLAISSTLLSCTKGAGNAEDVALEILVLNLQAQNYNCPCDPFLKQYIWREKTIYLYAYAGPTCSQKATYYDENSKLYSMPRNYTYAKFLEEAVFVQDVWFCKK